MNPRGETPENARGTGPASSLNPNSCMGVRARTSKEGSGGCHKRRALSASMLQRAKSTPASIRQGCACRRRAAFSPARRRRRRGSTELSPQATRVRGNEIAPVTPCQQGKSLPAALERLHKSLGFHLVERICSCGRERRSREAVPPVRPMNRRGLGGERKAENRLHGSAGERDRQEYLNDAPGCRSRRRFCVRITSYLIDFTNVTTVWGRATSPRRLLPMLSSVLRISVANGPGLIRWLAQQLLYSAPNFSVVPHFAENGNCRPRATRPRLV